MRRTSVFIAIAAFALGGVVGAYALLVERGTAGEPHPAWSETPWPFPIDQWGKGKAFRCKPADCGSEVVVYVRAKIGFCNCSTGVSDDEELDRISDYDLLGNKLSAQGPGREIKVAWMNGRSRAFAVAPCKRHHLAAWVAAESRQQDIASIIAADNAHGDHDCGPDAPVTMVYER